MLKLISFLLVGHFLGDFVFQPRNIAKRKSSDPIILFCHVCIVSYFILIASWMASHDFWFALSVTGLNFIGHYCIDITTWNLYKWANRYRPLFHEEQVYEDKWFWITLGGDQLLHGLTLLAIIGILGKF